MDNQLVASFAILGLGSLISAVGTVVSVLSKRTIRAFEEKQIELEKRADRIRDDFEKRCQEINREQDDQNRHINGMRVRIGVLDERTKNM